ncbi:MAG: hypothetical protein V3T83_07700 [Acidobacteriota bacterium]
MQSPALLSDSPDDLISDKRNWRITQADQTLLDAGLTSRRTVVYDSFVPSYDFFSLDSRVNVVEEEIFDFGEAPGPGPLARTTEFEYLHDADPAYDGLHIWDRVTKTEVKEPDGALASRTELLYDSMALEQTAGVVQHDYSSHPASMHLRGNVSQQRQWLADAPDPSPPDPGRIPAQKRISSFMRHDDLGNLVKAQDGNGNVYAADDLLDASRRTSTASRARREGAAGRSTTPMTATATAWAPWGSAPPASRAWRGASTRGPTALPPSATTGPETCSTTASAAMNGTRRAA